MFGNWSIARRRPAPTVPPYEPGAHYRAWVDRQEAQVAAIDEQIDGANTWAEVDALLDARNRIRPPRPAEVPATPGRTS